MFRRFQATAMNSGVVRAAILGAIVVTAASCGGSPASSPRSEKTSSSKVPPDAARFLSAAQEYSRHAGESALIAHRQMQGALGACRSLATGHPPELQDRINEGLGRLEFVMQGKVLARPYREYAAEIERIETSNAALKTVQANVAVVASEHNKLTTAEVDPCGSLRRWRDLGWAANYARTFQEQLYTTMGLERSRLRVAAKATAHTLPDLQKLGLSFEDALKISSSGMLVG